MLDIFGPVFSRESFSDALFLCLPRLWPVCLESVSVANLAMLAGGFFVYLRLFSGAKLFLTVSIF